MSTTRQHPVIIGTGLIAAAHVRALLELGLAPVAVWSPSRESRDRFANRWSIRAFDTLEEALEAPGATHAHICATPMQHLAPIVEAAKRKLTIVSEKPLAPTAELAGEALAAATSHGVANYVNFNRRQDEGVQALRAAIADGMLGEPVSVHGHYRQQWNASPSGLDWRYDPQRVGPARTVVEIGSHWLDLAAFVLNRRIVGAGALLSSMGERDYETISGEKGRVTPPNDDLFAALLRFEGGVVGQVFGTELSHGSFDEIEVRVDGTRSSAIWTSAHPGQLRIGDKTEGLRTIGLDVDTSALPRSIRAVYDGEAEARGVATFVDGLDNARAMDAIRLSAESGSWKEIR